MKLEKEIGSKLIFCSVDRPPNCQKQVNICCMLCEHQATCLEENKESNIKPCTGTETELVEDPCDFLI